MSQQPTHVSAQPSPFAAPPHVWQEFRPPQRVTPSRGFAIAALVAAGLLLLVDLAEAVTAWSAADAYATAADSGLPTVDVWTGYDLLTLVWSLTALAAYVTTCLWLWAARRNAEMMSHAPHARARGWVWAGWLVPIVSLWFPYQIVRDIRAAGRSTGERQLPGTGLWWGLWVGSLSFSQLGSLVASSTTSSGDSFALLGPLETLGALLLAAAFAVWVRIVLEICSNEDRAAAQAWR
ncbi:MAG: DUF4328 domain-containing protein [Actinomycetes bacterium]